METLAIGEVAKRAGVQTSALRYYERIGILPAAGRVNGRRRYGSGVLRTLAVVRLAQQAGFTLSEIGTMFEEFDRGEPLSTTWRAFAQRKLPEIDDLIRRAQAMRDYLEEGLRCDCLTLDECGLVAEQLDRNGAS